MRPNPYPIRSPEYRAWDAGYQACLADGIDQAEEWRPVPGSCGYEISSSGNFRRTSTKDGRPPRAIQGSIEKGGYRRYFIAYQDGRRKPVRAHRLVCEAFHGPRPSDRHFVAHGDGNRLNNHQSNLRWATVAENEADKDRHGTRAVGERHGMAKLSWADVVKIRAADKSPRELAVEFGVVDWTIRDILAGRRWKAPSPAERETRILEALFPQGTRGPANNRPESDK